jgi:hypothetical protein
MQIYRKRLAELIISQLRYFLLIFSLAMIVKRIFASDLAQTPTFLHRKLGTQT